MKNIRAGSASFTGNSSKESVAIKPAVPSANQSYAVNRALYAVNRFTKRDTSALAAKDAKNVRLTKLRLLILGDFGLDPLTTCGRPDLLEFLGDRVGS
ncbi:ATP-binding protein [Dyella terrae]|uniref:ATP-binding protein n=1 Tax=Dyella terrae TaxID=522259 RepID=UPI001EFE32EC|nr:ATP-binding protein [Dyella terrae]